MTRHDPAPTLVGLRISGWTERARWALDHHRIAYRYHEHLPLVGEALLRLRTPRAMKPSVPLMIEHGRTVNGSWAIARRSDEIGRGAPLFAAASVEAIRSWDARSDRVMNVARAFVVKRMVASRAAQAEQLPPQIPAFARPALAPLGALGAAFLGRKYSSAADPEAEVEPVVVPELEALRVAIGRGRYLEGGAFSYADVTMAACLQFVRPVDDRYIRLGPATREIWTHGVLAVRYADLVAWRDELYAAHRSPA